MHRYGLWRYIKNYRAQSMLVRNFVIVSLSVILTLILMLALTYRLTHNLINDSVLDMNETLVTQTVDAFESILDESTRMGSSLLNNNLTHRLMFINPEDAAQSQSLQQELAASTRTFLLVFEYLHSIYIYAEESGMLITHFYQNPISQFPDIGWLAAYEEAKDFELPALSRTWPGGHPYLLSIVMPYYFFVTEKQGAVVVNIDIAQLDRVFRGRRRFGEQQVYITDHDGYILYSRDRNLLARHIGEITALPELEGRASHIINDKGVDGRSIITNAPLRNRGWRLVSVLPLRVYDTHFDNLARAMRLLVAMLAGLGLAVTCVITLKLYAPVRDAIAELEQHGLLGSDNGRSGIRKGKFTEMEHLTSMLVNTAQDNMTMKTEMEKRMDMLKQAQAGALQAQIKPHFLSNTMDAIRWGAIKLSGGENEVSGMLHRLSLLLRLSLDMKDMLVSIKDEIEYSKAYIEIMTYRHANLQEVVWDIDDKLLGLTVVKLIFQPIIENAIYHGIMPKKAIGAITVTGALCEDEVHIYFADDGIGLKPGEADAINAQLSGSAVLERVEHVGMHNVNQRLKLMFGVKYGASISPRENGGVVVELVFPAIKR